MARALLHEILTKRLENWIINEGARELFYDSGKRPLNETRIQKILSLQISREVERLSMSVVREPQKLDDERVDFLISWGFSPNIRMLIELKKSDHGDLGPTKSLKTTKSYKKLLGYMKGYAAGNGFLMVMNLSKNPAQWSRLMSNIESHYKGIPGVTVVGVNCC